MVTQPLYSPERSVIINISEQFNIQKTLKISFENL